MQHSDGYEAGQCVACGARPIWHMPGKPPLCVRGKLVEQGDPLGELLLAGTLSVNSVGGHHVRIDFNRREDADRFADLLTERV